MKYLFFLMVLVGCSNDKRVPICLKFREEVLVRTDFYPDYCCRVNAKYDSSTYDLACYELYSPNFYKFVNGRDGNLIKGGCK